MPHPSIKEGDGVLAMFLSRLQYECRENYESENLHEIGSFYSREYILLNDPEVDTQETLSVIQRANNVVRENSDIQDFLADHVVVFTITGDFPTQCNEMPDNMVSTSSD